MTTSSIVDHFHREFGPIAERFEIYDLAVGEARNSKADHIWKPGVYVFWRPDTIIKVGRHLTNARKRALEHIRDNTGGIMGALDADSDARVLLFNVKHDQDKHWVAALEIFFESSLEPEIPADRLG